MEEEEVQEGLGGDLLTPKEAARYARVSLFTLNNMVKDGLVVFHTPGGHRRFSKRKINEYYQKSRRRPPK